MYQIAFPLSSSTGSVTDTLSMNGKSYTAVDFFGSTRFDSGVHDNNDGIFIMTGGPVKKGVPVHVSVLDITPTILYLLGLPVARDMDGKVLTDVIDEAYLKDHPVRYIASYETKRGSRTGKNSPAPAHTFEKEMVNTLRTVGYLQ